MLLLPTTAWPQTDDLPTRFKALADSGTWQMVQKIPLQFPSHHPQGVVKIGDYFYLTTTETIEPTVALFFRTFASKMHVGRGIGRLIQFDATGRVVRQIRLGNDTQYHVGGIDADAQTLWVPVAEHLPRGSSTIVTIDAATLEMTSWAEIDDHISAVAVDAARQRVYGFNWGTRTFYVWSMDGTLLREAPSGDPLMGYQDCHGTGAATMICGGCNAQSPLSLLLTGKARLDLVDLTTFTTIDSLPLRHRSDRGHLLTRNPMTVEKTQGGLRFYFIPEDHPSTLYIYDRLIRD
jgi:hypothetical protein